MQKFANGLIALFLLSLAVSVVWRSSVAFVDFFAQGILILLAVMVPLVSPTLKKAFRLPFGMTFVWGIWRFAYFDPVTGNDVPGIAYLFPPVVLGVIGVFVFGVRRWREELG